MFEALSLAMKVHPIMENHQRIEVTDLERNVGPPRLTSMAISENELKSDGIFISLEFIISNFYFK